MIRQKPEGLERKGAWLMLDIRNASLEDLDQVTELEARCFPENERADRETMKSRLEIFPNHFWLLERDGKLAAMANGMTVNQDSLSDDLYLDSSLHQEDGSWQMIFGLETDPAFRKRGYASILVKEIIKDCTNDFRSGIILNCLPDMVPFYEKLGFTDEGLADSTWGNQTWHSMKYRIAREQAGDSKAL